MTPVHDIDAVLAGLADRPFAERVEGLCEAFLDTPYDLNPCGDGPRGRYDRRPAMTFGAFNCITYVETVLALAFAGRVDRAAELVPRIRYRGGRVAFESRCYWIVGEWITNNRSNCLLREVPTDPEDLCGLFRREVDWADIFARLEDDRVHRDDVPASDRAELVMELRQLGAALPRLEVAEPFIPFGRLFELPGESAAALDRLSPPTGPVVVALFGEANEHVGLAFPNAGAWRFYHADLGRPSRVMRGDLLSNLTFRHRFTSQVGFRLFGIDPDWATDYPSAEPL